MKPHSPGAKRPQHPCCHKQPRPGPQPYLGAVAHGGCSVAKSCLDCTRQASLSFTVSCGLLKLVSTESVMPPHHSKEEDPGLQRKPTECPRRAWRPRS